MFLVLSVKNPQILKVIFEVMDSANSGNFTVNDDQRVVLQPIHSSDDSFTDGWVESTVTVRTALGKITGNPGEFVAQYVQDEQIHDMRYLSSLGYTSIGTATDVAFVHNTDSEVFIIGEGSRSAIYTLICDVLGQGVFDLGIDKEDVLFYESAYADQLKWFETRALLPMSAWGMTATEIVASMHSSGTANMVNFEKDNLSKSMLYNRNLTDADWWSIVDMQERIVALEEECQAIINKHARW